MNFSNEKKVFRPPWVDRTGVDEFGLWAEFVVGNARQRMRWIQPGRFMMGSPESEEGRWSAEGPQHQEIIGAGFWLFDTPCTQALWEIVMGDNPSYFNGSQRPVEQVSWDDCRTFLERLNGQLSGLALQLPNEAQWEYACRAGTETPRYHKDIDRIAWYSKNSENKVHNVAEKLPNEWGLFDMLGNVWEWCADIWKDNYDVKPETGTFAPRVIRGGSWAHSAESVRAAYRLEYHPSSRIQFLGFRCSSLESEPAELRASEGPERSFEAESGTGEDRAAKSDEQSTVNCPKKQAKTFEIRHALDSQ